MTVFGLTIRLLYQHWIPDIKYGLEYFLINLFTTLKQLFPFSYLRTFTGRMNHFVS